ncbi:MAG: proline--tRNA ligase [Firmicutes bacterium]|nr:proline--tRNA ligase [Bacillota bacterium]
MKQLDSITPRDVDFARWYTDVVTRTGLANYSTVKGCMIMPPYGNELWENMRAELDARIKKVGAKNVTLPLLIPESMLQREKDHIDGFAPEVLWITHSGEEKLAERLCLRPTSEVLFCEYFKNTIQSYRDLPMKLNQWANIFRAEKNTRPFLRTTEFFWQEGHTLHETEAEARKMTMQIQNLYNDYLRDFLALPLVEGRKTESEKFAGAVETYTREVMMYDGQALQTGTSHYLGTGFAKAFGITYQNREGREALPHYTSWGITTRMIGALVMVHGDDRGLVLPPHVAPIQAAIIPIMMHKQGILDAAKKLEKSIAKVVRTHVDASDNTPGWKYSEWEMRGVPVRIEYGPRDIENGTCVVVRRDTGEKAVVAVTNLKKELPKILQTIHDSMYSKALARQESMTYDARTLDEITEIAKTKPGFIRAPWCGCAKAEKLLKEKFATTSRCIVDEFKQNTDIKCAISGEPAKYMVIWGKAY